MTIDNCEGITLEDAKCISTAISYRYLNNHSWLHKFVEEYGDSVIDNDRLNEVREILASERYLYSERNVIAIAAYLVGKTVVSVESYDIITDENILVRLYPNCESSKNNSDVKISIKKDFVGMDCIFTELDNFSFVVDMITERDHSDRMKLNQYLQSHKDIDFNSYHWSKNRIQSTIVGPIIIFHPSDGFYI